MATNSGSSSSSKATVTTAVFKPGKGIPGVRRVITKAEAKAAWGAEIDSDLVWDRSNGHTLDVSGLPDAAKEYLKADKNFTLKDTEAS